jgi:hypothetical protein
VAIATRIVFTGGGRDFEVTARSGVFFESVRVGWPFAAWVENAFGRTRTLVVYDLRTRRIRYRVLVDRGGPIPVPYDVSPDGSALVLVRSLGTSCANDYLIERTLLREPKLHIVGRAAEATLLVSGKRFAVLAYASCTSQRDRLEVRDYGGTRRVYRLDPGWQLNGLDLEGSLLTWSEGNVRPGPDPAHPHSTVIYIAPAK